MKYMILIHSNPTTRAIWEGFSDAERGEGWQVYAELGESLVATGELVATEALADPSRGRRVPATEGELPTDGPFAEVKEHLAGFFLVECETFERAYEIAETIPEAPWGVVEVRPVLELGGPAG